MIETILNNFHLEKLFYIFKRRLALMLLVGVLFGAAGGAFAYVTNTTTYMAKVSCFVYSNPEYVGDSSVNLNGADLMLAKQLVENYMIVLKSDIVMEQVIDKLDLAMEPEVLSSSISYANVANTAIFYIYVYNQDPYLAMDIANAIADTAPAEISRIVKSGGFEVIDYAKLPTAATSSASVLTYGLLGFVGGFGIIFVGAMFFGLLDTTIRRKYELRLQYNIPILGEVPLMLPTAKGQKIDKILKTDSPFAIKESYSSIRSNLLFTGKGEKCPIYAVTSAEQNEGKTINSINIAKAMAQIGKKVLLIDADMRNASVHRQLDMMVEQGLSEYLAGLNNDPVYEELEKNFFVLPAGKMPPNPAELLSSDRMEELLTIAKDQFDCIVIDMPPAGIVSDALVVSDKIVGYILVVRVGVSKMAKETQVIRAMEQIDANICGFIFNAINIKSQDYTYRKSGYSYGYGSENVKKN